MGSFSEPSMSSTRPIITAGPIERKENPRNMGSVETFGWGPGGWPPPRPWAQVRPAMLRQAADAVTMIKDQRFDVGRTRIVLSCSVIPVEKTNTVNVTHTGGIVERAKPKRN